MRLAELSEIIDDNYPSDFDIYNDVFLQEVRDTLQQIVADIDSELEFRDRDENSCCGED